MNNDRELLELAAKAAGMPMIGKWCADGYELPSRDPVFDPVIWNPLTDDGDALRLAVKLRMSIVITALGPSARSEDAPSWADENCAASDDYAAATRRAIVRAAAAEIGKAA